MTTLHPQDFLLDKELIDELQAGLPLAYTNLLLQEIIKCCSEGKLVPVKVFVCHGFFYLMVLDPVIGVLVPIELSLDLEKAIVDEIHGISRPSVKEKSIYFMVAVKGLLFTYRIGLHSSRKCYEVACEGFSLIDSRTVNGEFKESIKREGNGFWYGEDYIDINLLNRELDSIHGLPYNKESDHLLVSCKDGTLVRVALEKSHNKTRINFSFEDDKYPLAPSIIYNEDEGEFEFVPRDCRKQRV